MLRLIGLVLGAILIITIVLPTVAALLAFLAIGFLAYKVVTL